MFVCRCDGEENEGMEGVYIEGMSRKIGALAGEIRLGGG
jgi:lipoate-protein ligase B